MTVALTIAMYAAYVVYRVGVDRKAAATKAAIMAEQQRQSERLTEIEAVLKASPFVNFPNPLKL
jgi:hypothetical protein